MKTLTLLKIPNTLEVLKKSWLDAEKRLRDNIDENPDVNEEYITAEFTNIYCKELSTVSKNKKIENAFVQDLKKKFSFEYYNEVQNIANGLIARLTLHERKTEGVTGGDIGIIIIRPNILEEYDGLKNKNYKRGLLCQAKLKNNKGKWGNFTKSQKKVLPERLSYLSLLLYSYSDKTRHSFNPFSWQLCNVAELTEIEKWLKDDKFPNLVESNYIIDNLGNGIIGTDDDDIINSFVSPPKNKTLIIEITWPDDPNKDGVKIYSKHEKVVEQKIEVYSR